jgi:4-amino-4-deoxy-L-arabinose transferase-like glycosyltransferase
MAAYPPLNMMLLTASYTTFGASILSTRMVAIFECIIMLFVLFKLCKLYSTDRRFPYICVLLVAFNPIVFFLGATNFLAMGLLLFTVTTTYFIAMFEKTQKNKYLYLSALTLGLGFIVKVQMVLFLPSLLVLFAFSRNKKRLISKTSLKAFAVFIAAVSPLIIQILLLSRYRMLDIFIDHYTHSSLFSIDVLVFNIFSIIPWFLLPFFMIGVYLAIKNPNAINKIILTIIPVFIFYFSVFSTAAQSRMIAPVIPFAIILSCVGLVFVFKEYIKVIGVFILLSVIFIFGFYASTGYYGVSALDDAAIYIIEDTDNPTTVLTTWGQPQMFEFARLDTERKIYTMYMPYEEINIPRAIDGDFSYYSSQELWNKFGIEHPIPEYVILHERAIRGHVSYDYNASYFESNPDFELLKVIDSENEPYNRIFIYRIVH